MKTFVVKMSQELHTKVKIAAAQTGKTMLDWVIEAIEEKLKG